MTWIVVFVAILIGTKWGIQTLILYWPNLITPILNDRLVKTHRLLALVLCFVVARIAHSLGPPDVTGSIGMCYLMFAFLITARLEASQRHKMTGAVLLRDALWDVLVVMPVLYLCYSVCCCRS